MSREGFVRIKGDRIHGLFSPILINGLYIGVITHLLGEIIHSYLSNGLFQAPGKCYQSLKCFGGGRCRKSSVSRVMLVVQKSEGNG